MSRAGFIGFGPRVKGTSHSLFLDLTPATHAYGMKAWIVLLLSALIASASTPPAFSQRFANEPLDSQLLVECNFDQPLCGHLGSSENARIVSDGSAVRSPSNVLEYSIAAGATAGGGTVEYALPGLYDSIYEGFYIKTSDPFEGMTNLGNKIAGFWNEDGTPLAGIMGSQLFGPYQVGITMEIPWDNCHLPNNGCWGPGTINIVPNTGNSGSYSLGQWHLYEIFMRRSSSATSRDGIVKIWLDGTLVIDVNELNMPGRFYATYFTPAWDGSIKPVSSSFWHHYDHVRIATCSNCTFPNSGPVPPPPPPPADTTPPAVAVASPADGATVSGTINVSVNASDSQSGVAGVNLVVDGSMVSNEVASPPYTLSLNTLALANGPHTLTASARDAAGNIGASAPVAINVQNGPQPPGSTYSSSADFSTSQGYKGWFYLDSTGAQMSFDASNSRWQGGEQYLTLSATRAHPGNFASAVRRWVAPSAGLVRISGQAADAHTGCGSDGVGLTINKAGAQVFARTIALDDSTGVSFDLTEAIAAGEALDFILDNGGIDWDCDSTSFQATITYTAPPNPLPTDVNADGQTDVTDVQLAVNQALGAAACGSGDMDGDGSCSVTDVQRIVNAALGL